MANTELLTDFWTERARGRAFPAVLFIVATEIDHFCVGDDQPYVCPRRPALPGRRFFRVAAVSPSPSCAGRTLRGRRGRRFFGEAVAVASTCTSRGRPGPRFFGEAIAGAVSVSGCFDTDWCFAGRPRRRFGASSAAGLAAAGTRFRAVVASLSVFPLQHTAGEPSGGGGGGWGQTFFFAASNSSLKAAIFASASALAAAARSFRVAASAAATSNF